MTVEEVITVLAMQEEILQFNHFTNEDAWELGNLLVAEAKKRELDTTVEIRLNNGYTVFKYAGNGTTPNNEIWADKMFASVSRMEKSTMLLYSELKRSEETMEDIGLGKEEYSCLGGGFPVRVEEVGVIGAIMVTNQSHFVNHDIIVKALSRYLHIDETHVQVLKEPGRKNTSDSYMWVYCSIRDAVNPIRYFEYQPGRSGKYPEAFLREYEGYIHTDAYSGYNAVSGVKRCLCYTHLRRAFVDALPKDIHNSEASKPAEAILRLNQLFNIESELEALPPDQKKKERLIREKPLLEAFWSWAEKSAIGELPKSKLSKAFHYALNNREGFWNYLEDGNCSISNSLAENCIRPFVIGRKNWLFSGSPKGAEASAGIYTLVETAKANGLAPMKYIKYILSDMPGSAFLEHPEYLDDYLPWNPLVKEFCR